MVKYGNREDYFYDGSHYISKEAYYRDATFLIYPNWEEVNRKILIPGDRWHPFCPSSLPPWKISLLDGSRVLPLKEVTYPADAIQNYHILLGKELIMMNLIENHSFHRNILTLPVIDMKEFYEEKDFRPGDALRIRVLDYQEALYSVEYVPRTEKEALDHQSDSWLSLMEQSMEKVISLFGDRLILPRQVDWAYFIGGRKLMNRPTANIRNFLERTEHFSLTGKDGIYFLVKR